MSVRPLAGKKSAAGKPRDSDEDERRRLARELHDDIGQRLALLADDAATLRQDLRLSNGVNRQRLDKLVQQARQLGEYLRRISHALHPAILEDLGLIPALRLLIEEFTQRTGMPVEFSHVDIPIDLPPIMSVALYRISQEALRNVGKHAGQTSVHIVVSAAHGEISLVITDSGSGFNTGTPGGLGLTSIGERADLVGGTLCITSAPGKGTTLQVHIPLPSGASHPLTEPQIPSPPHSE